MTAHSRDWKETQAIERALKSKEIDEKAWAESQLAEHDQVIEEEIAREAAG